MAMIMLTYDFTSTSDPLYLTLYRHIKNDILSGVLDSEAKMPSKRALAKNLGISTITVENAYGQLVDEGFLFSLPKKGYFVSKINTKETQPKILRKRINQKLAPRPLINLSSSQAPDSLFPFSVWAKLMREAIAYHGTTLLSATTSAGIPSLKSAIANHLKAFRSMEVNPEQIIIGAGTEYLYGLLCKLLGTDKLYCLETPGHRKISQIYRSNQIRYKLAPVTEDGLCMQAILQSNAQVIHVSPTHHFPTGITMPINRRYELLAWANSSPQRYIIEDDYDSEFRLNGLPIPALFSIDACDKVIYVNTFSMSLAPTLRISYMVLPVPLIKRYNRELSFYSCTVSTFEQFALAQFIERGHFEKHINRMRLHHARTRGTVLKQLQGAFSDTQVQIVEHDSGLHFLLRILCKKNDDVVKAIFADHGLRLASLGDFEVDNPTNTTHTFVLRYGAINAQVLPHLLAAIQSVLT